MKRVWDGDAVNPRIFEAIEAFVRDVEAVAVDDICVQSSDCHHREDGNGSL